MAAGEGGEQGGTWTEPSEWWRRSAAPPAWTRAVRLAAASTLRSGARSGGVAETERQPLRESESERSEGAPRRAPEVLDGREDVAWALPGARARAVRASAARVRWGCAVADVRDLSELFLIG